MDKCANCGLELLGYITCQGCGFQNDSIDGVAEDALHELDREDSTCAWSYDSDGFYKTQCDNAFVFIADRPKQNGFRFCPYCGREIKETSDET